MTIGGMFESVKRYGYVIDRKYKAGEISEKTGLQKQPDGSWRAPKDKLGKPFETGSSGNVDFGAITPEQAEAMGTNTEAPIRLSLGDETYGKIHLSEYHKSQLEQHGYKDINSFVEDIAGNFDEIRQGKKTPTRNTFLLVKKTSRGCLFIELEKSDKGNYYGVNSGGIFSQRYLEKHRPLWSATHSTDTALNHDRSVILPATDKRFSADNERTASKGLRISLTQDEEIIKFFERYESVFEIAKEYRAGKKELELQTAYRKFRQPHGALDELPANVRNATALKNTIPDTAPQVKPIAEMWEIIKQGGYF